MITGLRVDQKGVSLDEERPFKPGKHRFVFDYTALSLLIPERVLFKHKLEGFHDEWTSPTPKRQAEYTNLSPGDYVLRVVACNNDGLWNETGRSWSFRVETYYYQRPWFLALVALALAGSWLGVYRWRTYRIVRQNEMLEAEVRQRTRELADANSEIVDLNERLKTDNLRLSAEVEVTRRLQKMILPTQAELDGVENLDIAGYMEPADEVGGDYYDVLRRGEMVKIGMGDVTGHGLESGVVMLMTQTAVRTLLNAGVTDPVSFLDVLNRTIYDNVERMEADKSLTLCLLDYRAGSVTLSGQHEEMIVVRRDGEAELVDTVDLGFPIGLDDDIRDFIAETTTTLETGDGVVLYTDGITEAGNPAGEQYGLERLFALIRQQWAHPAQAVLEAVIDDVREFVDGHEIYDDISLLVLKQQ